jgi:cobalamin-dependent methionine synthase I
MTSPNLIIIGERINPGFRSTKALFDNEDINGIQELAVRQKEAGASYLNVNIGRKTMDAPEFMVEIIEAIQAVVDIPLSFDSPSAAIQELCLKAYDREKAGGAKPILNSVAESRWELVQLTRIQPFKIILMASERVEDGVSKANKFSKEVATVAKRMTHKLVSQHGFDLDDIIIDVSISALAVDMEGLTKMAIEGIKLIGLDPELKGVHMSGGLSNLGQQLPAKGTNGTPLKLQLENAFLTLVVPYGFNMVLGTPWRNYQLLPEDDIFLQSFKAIVELKGIDAMRSVVKLYRN